MAIQLKIQSPSVEKKVFVEEVGASITIGLKAYSSKQAKDVRKKVSELTFSDDIDKKTAYIADFIENGDKLDDSFYTQRKILQDELNVLVDERETSLETFFKTQILYIKFAALVVDGKELSVPDTREAQKFVSLDGEILWNNSDECLAALLDTYFEVPPFRDAIVEAINKNIYNIKDSKDAKRKN